MASKHSKGFGRLIVGSTITVLSGRIAAALVLKSQLPPEGSVFILHVTEKQFASMEILLGESNSEFLSNDERLIKL